LLYKVDLSFEYGKVQNTGLKHVDYYFAVLNCLKGIWWKFTLSYCKGTFHNIL